MNDLQKCRAGAGAGQPGLQGGRRVPWETTRTGGGDAAAGAKGTSGDLVTRSRDGGVEAAGLGPRPVSPEEGGRGGEGVVSPLPVRRAE